MFLVGHNPPWRPCANVLAYANALARDVKRKMARRDRLVAARTHAAARRLTVRGRKMQIRVPCSSPDPDLLLTEMVPPCLWMISFATHSPSPVPVFCLVVKNGSKIRSR